MQNNLAESGSSLAEQVHSTIHEVQKEWWTIETDGNTRARVCQQATPPRRFGSISPLGPRLSHDAERQHR